MRSLEEHCKAAKEKAKQQQRKRRMEVRCFEIGRIVCERFPELRKYQPKYGDATSDKIHDDLVAVVDFLAANRELLDQIKAEAFGESTEYHSPGDAVDF